jgi:Spy/CpxP family protein refolding chaperone
MKITKRLAAATILLSLGLPALAQSPSGTPTPGGHHHRGHHEWGKDLNLTADQKTKIENIRKTIKDRAEREAAINKVLTPQQQATLAADKAKHQHKDKE